MNRAALQHPARQMALALGLAAALVSLNSEARSLRECGRSVRVGSGLVMAGDDSQRARKLFAEHHQWKLVRRSRQQMTWRNTGRSARTVRLTLKDGRVSKVCQLD